MGMQINDCTTKRHPRTLNEAFPGTVEYACAIERYERWSPLRALWARFFRV